MRISLKSSVLAVAAATLAAGVIFGAGGEAAARSLKWAHVYETSSPYHTWAEWAAEEVKKRSGGALEMEVFPASSLGNEVDINEGLTLGTVDVIYTGQLFAGRSYGPIAIGGSPYMFRDFKHWAAYRDSDLFKDMAGGYRDETGNEVNLDVTPFPGMLEKARNAVRDEESPYDLVNIDTAWTIEFYEAGFLTPITDIDPGFVLPEQVIACGNAAYWNAEKRWRTPDGGVLMAVSPNCNTHILVYRRDLTEASGMAEPQTYEDIFAICEALQDPPDVYGFVTRGERGNAIRFDWMPFMLSYGASIVADPENGDFTVTINSPAALEALNTYIRLMTECGPPNYGSIGQGDMIQLMATGKALMAQAVIAAWPSFEDPTRSAVVGQVGAARMPSHGENDPGVVIGNWELGVPANLPAERQQAAVAFLEWFLGEDVQRAYAESGGIPVRGDVLTGDLSEQDAFRWMPEYYESVSVGQQVLGYSEGAEIEQIIGLHLNRALIGEISPAAALNRIAAEAEAVFAASGRSTGLLDPLPE